MLMLFYFLLLQILNMAGGFISRLIKFVRYLPEFSELSQHDQVALLKVSIDTCTKYVANFSCKAAVKRMCLELSSY